MHRRPLQYSCAGARPSRRRRCGKQRGRPRPRRSPTRCSSCGGSGRQCSERADNNQDKRSARQRPPSRGVARRMDRVPLYYKSDRHTLQRIFSLPQAERYVIVIYYAGMMELADMRDLGDVTSV